MASHIFRPSGKLFLFVIAVLGIACFSVSAFAQNVTAGCDPAVWNALNAKAEAQVAYDSAVTRQMINKPDSVLTLTCFDQAAAVSSVNGGAIFSGDFSTQLKTIMPVNINLNTANPPAATYNCTAIGTLWNTIAKAGIQTAAPYATFNDLLTGTVPPGGGVDFKTGWDAANTAGVFGNLNSKVAALPVMPVTPLNFTGAKSSCDVLAAAGIIAGPCP